MITLVLVSTVLLLLATAAKPVPRHAFPRTERVSGDLEAQVAYWHAKAKKRLRLASRYESQRNRLRAAMRRQVMLGANGVARGFLCIHHFEGAWNANTGNGYHGGLQMDGSFMSSYGGAFYRALGGAENWPPFVQISVAMAAYYSGRGYGPWPNTRRACGI